MSPQIFSSPAFLRTGQWHRLAFRFAACCLFPRSQTMPRVQRRRYRLAHTESLLLQAMSDLSLSIPYRFAYGPLDPTGYDADQRLVVINICDLSIRHRTDAEKLSVFLHEAGHFFDHARCGALFDLTAFLEETPDFSAAAFPVRAAEFQQLLVQAEQTAWFHAAQMARALSLDLTIFEAMRSYCLSTYDTDAEPAYRAFLHRTTAKTA